MVGITVGVGTTVGEADIVLLITITIVMITTVITMVKEVVTQVTQDMEEEIPDIQVMLTTEKQHSL